MSEHTPLPWEVSEDEDDGLLFGYAIEGRDEEIVAEGIQSLDDAELIVRACNAHHDLLAACENVNALNEFLDGHLSLAECNAICTRNGWDGNEKTKCLWVDQTVRDAIAKTTGGKL